MNNSFKILAITFCGRSGSFFLQSLLDNHPNIIHIPTTQLSIMFKPWENSEFLEKGYILDIFDHYISVICDAKALAPSAPLAAKSLQHFALPEGLSIGEPLGLNSLGENGDICLKVDENSFRKALNQCLEPYTDLSFLQFFEAFHVAYHVALNGGRNKLPKDMLIVYQLHGYNPIPLKMLYKGLPGKVFHVQMVRNPVAAIGSHLKMLQRSCPQAASQLVYNNVTSGFNEVPELSNNTYSIRLEDLHAEPETSLRALCKWVGIKWSSTLLESTFHGYKYWNVKDSDRVSGFNKVTTGKKYDDVFSKIDILRIKILCREQFVFWKYDSRWKKLAPIISLYHLFLFTLISLFPCKFIQIMPTKQTKYYREHIHFMKKSFLFLVRRFFKRDKPKIIPLIVDTK